jgi:hypothetical protein
MGEGERMTMFDAQVAADAYGEPHASDHPGCNELDGLQAELPVSLIATPRENVVFCKREDQLAIARAQADALGFDFLPVRDARDVVVGVLDVARTRQLPGNLRVAEHFHPISERFLIGGEASIIEFLRWADQRPFRLLVNGHGIDGVASLSDIQRLPVRAALFALVTQLELALAQLVRLHVPEDAQWMARLKVHRRRRLLALRAKASVEGRAVELLHYTQFADKVWLVRGILKELARGYPIRRYRRAFENARRLRDQLAHGAPIAPSHGGEEALCQLVRELRWWLAHLHAECQRAKGGVVEAPRALPRYP